MTETTHVQTLCSGCGRVTSVGWEEDGLRKAHDQACPYCGGMQAGDLIILKTVQVQDEKAAQEAVETPTNAS